MLAGVQMPTSSCCSRAFRLTSKLLTSMRTSVEPLEGNKVKLSVEVDEEEIRREEDGTLHRLSREVSMPGFRPGRAPQRLIASRLGAKGLRQEVLRDAVPRYLEEAVEEQSLDVIAQPEVDITAGEEGGVLSFDAVVEVRPEISVPGYEHLSVTVPSPEVTDADIDAQLDRLREQFASLAEVSREAAEGDVLSIDVKSTRDGQVVDGLSVEDFVYEVGSGGIAPGLDEKLVGTKASEQIALDVDDAPGGPVHIEVQIKQVSEKVLPEANDAFASDASEFDTLAELREDLFKRTAERKRAQAALALQEQAIDALVELVSDEPPAALVDPEANQLLHNFAHRLANQRVRLEDYLAAIGQAPDEFVAELREQAIRQVKADLALRALAAAEDIEVEESDVDEEIVAAAAQNNTTPASLRESLERDGRLAELRSQLKRAKALRWLVEHVAVVDEEGKPVDRSALVAEAEAAASSTVEVEA